MIEVDFVKKNTVRVLLGLGTVIVAVGGYLLWPEKKIPVPENAIVLDKSKIENSEFYLSEDNFEEDMINVVEPYLNELRTNGYFKGYDGEELYYEQYLSGEDKGHVVVVHGFTDATYKFREVMYYFLKSGYSVSALEHRGHGHSYRAVENMSKVSIESFDEYKDDMKIFLNDIVKPTLQPGEKLFAYAHSMGGGITALLVEEDNTLFDAVVLTAPMMEIEFGGVPNNVATLVANGAFLLGREDEYTAGTSDYVESYDFANSSYTSQARYDYVSHLGASDEMYRMSGGNYKWLSAAVEAAKAIRENAEKYTTDTLLFQAKLDTTVGPNGQNEFATKASNVQLIVVEDAKHSILFADNSTFIPYMNTILEFYKEHLK